MITNKYKQTKPLRIHLMYFLLCFISDTSGTSKYRYHLKSKPGYPLFVDQIILIGNLQPGEWEMLEILLLQIPF